MRRETQHVLLVLLGGALLRIAADDTHLRYVRPSHRWLLVAAGAVLVVLAVVALVRDRRGTHHDGAGEHGDHGAAERHVPWLLLAPVLVIALVAPPALGADAVARAGPRNAVVQDADVFPPLADGAALTVAEFVQRAAWDTAGSLDGREVTLTGFAVRRGAAVELARLTIACCAADARPNRVRLVGDLGDPPPDTWLRVRGTLQSGSATAATGYVPAMTVAAAEVVDAPPDPYEY
ncbi:MAG: TIGR03943 family protein [Pseudonocardiales bacterium]|nr:TIGR03943 family protein [Pseudonocardiales bacterium]